LGKRVLLIGQGGREHALAWKIAQSPVLEKLYAAPGNPGMEELCQCIPIPATDVKSLLDFALQEKIDLTVVGPEAPLMEGIVDLFEEHGLTIFGPTNYSIRYGHAAYDFFNTANTSQTCNDAVFKIYGDSFLVIGKA
jgi:phosphoribosylamine--glycine ligase